MKTGTTIALGAVTVGAVYALTRQKSVDLKAGRYYTARISTKGLPDATDLTADDVWLLVPQLMNDIAGEPFEVSDIEHGKFQFSFKARADRRMGETSPAVGSLQSGEEFETRIASLHPYRDAES